MVGKWRDAWRRGREAGAARYGGRPPPQPKEGPLDEWPHETNRDGQWNLDPGPDGPPQPDSPVPDDVLAASEIEALRARIAELEAKALDDAQRLAGLNVEIGQLLAQRVEDKQLVDTLTEGVADLRTALEEMALIGGLLIDVLALPGVKRRLQERFHPDKYPDATEAQRREYEDASARINAAYDIVAADLARRQELDAAEDNAA